jgi:hypothetical protein
MLARITTIGCAAAGHAAHPSIKANRLETPTEWAFSGDVPKRAESLSAPKRRAAPAASKIGWTVAEVTDK